MAIFGTSPDEVPISEAQRLAGDGYRALDVRQHEEFAAGHVPGALHIPLHLLPLRLEELDGGARWLAICRSGARSAQAIAFLQRHGMRVLNVSGGMGAWLAAGLPVHDMHGHPGRVL